MGIITAGIFFVLSNVLDALILKCYFLLKTHGTEQIHFKMVFPPVTHFTAESTEAMQIMCLAHGHGILMHPVFEPSIAESRNRHLSHMPDVNHCLSCILLHQLF